MWRMRKPSRWSSAAAALARPADGGVGLANRSSNIETPPDGRTTASKEIRSALDIVVPPFRRIALPVRRGSDTGRSEKSLIGHANAPALPFAGHRVSCTRDVRSRPDGPPTSEQHHQ